MNLPANAVASAARLVAGITLAAFLLSSKAIASGPTPGKPVAPFSIKTLDGRVIDSAQLAGKVVIVHFWATWCPPCREEMPALEAFSAQHRGEGLETIAVSIEDAMDEPKVRAYVKPFSFPVGLAANSRIDGFGRIWVLPLTFVIDRAGIVRKTDWTGDEKLDAASLDKIVLPLLKQH